MEVNLAPTPRSPAVGQSSTGPAGSSDATAHAADREPSLKLGSPQATSPNASIGNIGDSKTGVAATEDLKKAETLRAMIADKNMQLRTYHDEASGHSVLEVSDQATGKVVSQYPSHELLRLYAALREPLVDQRA